MKLIDRNDSRRPADSSAHGCQRDLPSHITCAAGLLLAGLGVAQAQTTFDVIGPGEYDLPADFEPFNVFVQYATLQDNAKYRDADGDSVAGSGTEQLVGLSKYVRFWSPQAHRRIGAAWEIIAPEISIRDRRNERYVGGIGDPLTGFALWYKPTAGSTLGLQSFLQIPVGDDSVSDGNWKNLSSLLWNLRSGALQITGDAGVVWQGQKVDGFQPGLTLHTNNRMAWAVHSRLEPFIGLDYENTASSDDVPTAWALDGGLGLVLHSFANQSITLRYSTTLDGKNHSQNNSFNIKYGYVW